MGGNLLKTWNLPEKRIPTSEYNQIKNELIDKFRTDFKCNRPVNLCIAVAPSIRDKETHGDLDLIIGKWEDVDIWMFWKGATDFADYLQNEFGYKPFKNSNVYSFPYKGFQVDVTFQPMIEFEMATNYSSWGDLGNIMGRVFHKMGLHFGHSGLSFWIRQGLFDANVQWSDSDHIYHKTVLTTNMEDICEIGGFDYKRWSKGFDTEKDAFDFVISSKYFNKELFALENLNHTNRTRNRKRGMYMRFVVYVANCDKVGAPFRSKHEYSLIMQCRYPHLQRSISNFRFVYEIDKIVKEKINGRLVAEWCHLTEKDGPLIGKIMSEVRDVTKYILLEMSQEEIKQFVVDTHAKCIKVND